MRTVITATVVVLAGCSLGAADPKPEVVPVVKEAEFVIRAANPPVLVVTAVGQVMSLGYSKPALTRATYTAPPKDGVQEYTLTAIPPAEAAGQALADVTAEDAWTDFEKEAPWLKGVRIKGKGDEVKVVWIKPDVVVGSDANAGTARVGQVVEVQVSYGVFPPFPSDFAVSIGGEAVPHSGHPGAVTVDGRPVVGSALYGYRFPVMAKGKQKVTVSYKRGQQKDEKVVELDVTE
jgi:hypothetical protein